MFFTKFPHPANFSFAKKHDRATGRTEVGSRTVHLAAASYKGGVHSLIAEHAATWPINLCLEPVQPPEKLAESRLSLSEQGVARLTDAKGRVVLEGAPGECFGLSGPASLFQFVVPDEAQFFGMGEKWFGKLELSGIRTKFWNTDVWSDFHWGQWSEHAVDPPYCSVPYLAVRTNQGWLGFLLHNPGVTFMETPGNDQTRVFVEWQRTSRHLILGSECGEPHLWIIEAGSLAELTRKLQSLVGKTPLPPLWSLGFHQSRWGYGGHKDLLSLDRKFAQHKIPCSGLWLDLDYMDGYRIFEVSKAQFPKGVADTAAALEKNGRRIVPIIDPGVKREPGYWVYDQGVERGAFCKNQEGADFVGLVWPGETVFPDFSLPEVRAWWAGLSKTFRESGFGAAWVDMNDPSTGPVDPTDMRFGHGSQSHESQRNQYALGMQMATVEGFLQARPDERPFLLSRSGFIGTSKWSAVWTGDNLSNEHYLRQCVPTTLGMAISGIPFNGPDLGGFGGDADDELIIRWFQACMLFPFYRNHSTLDSRNEEPWAYPAKTRKLLAQSVRTRYELLPYIYQLFVEQSESGEAMVRPLIYDFDEPALASVSDQFMVGASLMHCPVLELGKSRRTCVLPGSEPWFDMIGEEWVQPGERTCKAKTGQTPLFLRQGSIVSAERTTPTDNSTHLCSPRLVVAGSPTFEGSAHCQYHADDGLSFGYRRGERSTLQIEVEFSRTRVEVKSVQTQHGFGEIFPEFAVLDDVREVFLNGNQVATEPDVVTWSGKPTRIFKTIF